jgi:type II secretory pathway component PulF
MSRFSYQAILPSGQRVSGSMNARDRHDALGQLVHRGYHPLTMETLEKNSSDVGRSFFNLWHRVTRSDLAVFTRQLASLLKAGLTIVQALNTLRSQCDNPRLAGIIQDMEDKLQRDGGSFAETLDDHPQIFDAVYRGLIRAGEEGGTLTKVLTDLAQHLSQSAKLRRQVIGAFIYPVFLLLLGAAAVFVLMAFVIPRFQELFISFNSQLPGPTRVLILISGFMANWWWAIVTAIAFAILLVIAGLRKIAIRTRVDRMLLRVPVLGVMFLKLEIARLSQTLAALLQGGVPILDALRITADTVKNLTLRATFSTITKRVSAGEDLALSMETSGQYPSLVINLLKTGEETGELPEMLKEVSDIYEDEAERAVTGAVKLLEPILICVMGIIIAGIIAAVILPIFRVNVMAEG